MPEDRPESTGALLDKRRVRESFAKAAAGYDAGAVLQREVGSRLLERLDLVRLRPERVLDAGAGTGADSEALLRRYPGARVVALDLATPMLHAARKRGRWLRRPACVCGDLESLPLASASVDLVFSNLALQWVNDLPRVFRECRRVLRPGGLLMFTSLGPDTLTELRQAWSQVDGRPHVSRFIDMHDVGDAVMRAGLAEPVMDVERFTLTYQRVDQLMRDLKTIGASNAASERAAGLTGPSRMRRMREAYERFRRDGRLPASYEVVYGHAWAPDATSSEASSANGAEVRIPIDRLRRGG